MYIYIYQILWLMHIYLYNRILWVILWFISLGIPKEAPLRWRSEARIVLQKLPWGGAWARWYELPLLSSGSKPK